MIIQDKLMMMIIILRYMHDKILINIEIIRAYIFLIMHSSISRVISFSIYTLSLFLRNNLAWQEKF
jgi:hypothetical protein